MGVNEWIKYSVNQLVEANMLEKPLDGNHGSSHPKSSDYVDYGIPFIMANDLENGKINYETCNYITEEQAQTLKKGFAKCGDVLLTHKATIGRTAIVDGKFDYIVLTPQVTYYRVVSGIDNKYLKYYFDSTDFQSLIKNWASSGSTRLYIGITAQLDLPVLIPPIHEQKAIAKVLSAFDDKIEINNKIINKLEEVAQTVFKNWFVDYEPFRDGEFEESELGRIPKGWRVGSLDEIADYLNGLAMQKFRPDTEESLPVIKIKELNQGKIDENSDKATTNLPVEYIVNDGDVIFSWSGTLMVKIWFGGSGGLNQHLFKVTSQNYDKWFYYLWTKHHLNEFIEIARSKATTMGHIQRMHLQQAKVLIPTESDYKRINNILSPIVSDLINRGVQNRIMSQLRDSILPKLISGEIRLREVF